MNVMLRIRTIIAIGPLLGCTPLPPAPTFTPADVSSSKDALASDLPDAPPSPDVAIDGDAPAALDGSPDADVALLDTALEASPDVPDAPPPSAARLTGAFVSSGSSSARLSGGFVWHGGSSRLSGWLQ